MRVSRIPGVLFSFIISLSSENISAAEETKVSAVPLATDTSLSPVTYQIIDRIDDKNIFTAKDTVAVFSVNTKAPFQIIQYKETGKFGPAYNKEELDKGNPFLKGRSPLAIVEPANSGLAGGFEIYSLDEHNRCPSYTSGEYCVHYNPKITSTTLSRLIYIPVHTYVSPQYAQEMNTAVQSLPPVILDFLTKQAFKVMIGYNGRECYWKTWPFLKIHDESLSSTRSTSASLHQRVGKWQWTYRGKYIEALGIFKENKAAIPERYFKFGTEEQIKLKPESIKSTLFHEVGHKLNRKGEDDKSLLFSDDQDFKTAYNEDLKKITEEEEKKLEHLLVNRDETFATIAGILLGGYPAERAAFVLSKFPKTARQIAKILEEKYRFSMK